MEAATTSRTILRPFAETSEPAETERLVALEASLRDRERELEEAHRIARLGTWRWVKATDTLTWSPEVYRIYGCDPSLPPPRHDAVRKLMSAESHDQVLAAVQRCFATGEPYALDLQVTTLNGEPRWVLSRGEVAERGIDGEITVIRGTVQDITERKLHEQQLARNEAATRDSQSRFQRLYEANLMGICYPDKFGAFFDGNEEFLRIVGYSREELAAGMVRWDTMTPPEYAELDLQHIAEADERGSCTPYEKEYVRKDGSRVPILCGYALLEGSDQNYIGFVTDLTAQKQAERALLDREQRFRELAESLPQMVWEARPDTRITYVNRRWVAYTGLGIEDMSGSLAQELIHPEDIERTEQLRLRSFRTCQPYTAEVRMRRHDGVYRRFLARAVPVHNDRAEVERWIGTLTDIHDQHMAEEALRRTEKLAATGRLAASIAHEINNPLEAVTNALYLALQMEPSQQVREYLQLAEQELARVAQVTSQTLRFHRQPTAAEVCDLAEVLESAVALFLPRFQAAGIEVQRDYRPHDKVNCYSDELRQVFVNLLGNALDAMRKGGHVRLCVRPSTVFDGVRITIADTGHGIPTDLRTQVFEAFLSTKDDTGTGLGLWVSEGIVRKHKGRIVLRSRTSEPSGTVFSIFLPYKGVELAKH
jgi:PAS domain S-box-containing protein